MASVPGLAHRLGDLGHLLFQSTVCRIACSIGDVLCGTSDMAALAVEGSVRAGGLRRAVSWRGCLVAIHFSGSRRNAAGDD